MFTYKLIIAKGNSLRLRLTNNRRKTEISLGLQLSESDLTDTLSDKPSARNLGRRKYLLGILAKLEQIRIDLNESGHRDDDIKDIKDIVNKAIFNITIPERENPNNFVKWFKAFADTHTNELASTKGCYLHTLNRLYDYCKSQNPAQNLDKVEFGDITVMWLDGFDAFLSKTCKVNSRNHHMRNIRAVFKYAIRNDLDIRNPFDRMRLKKEKTAKRALSVEELRQLFNYPVEPYAEIYRDMFKLSFLLIGINPVDLYRLDGINHGAINYRRAKTHKPYTVKVEPEAMQIIEKYRGNSRLLNLADRWKRHDSFTKACNRALKGIGALPPAPGRKKIDNALFPDLTLYWARHTWATIAARLDVPKDTIAAALGHGGNTVTDIYIDFDQKKIDEANRKVLDYVFGSI